MDRVISLLAVCVADVMEALRVAQRAVFRSACWDSRLCVFVTYRENGAAQSEMDDAANFARDPAIKCLCQDVINFIF